MKDETKSIITRESCAKSLIYEALAYLPAGIMGFLLCVLFCALLFWGSQGCPPVVMWVCIIIAVAFIIFFLYALIYLIALRIVLVKSGRFAIVEDTLTAIAEEESIRHTARGTHVKIEQVFYFENHGRYVTTPLDGSQYSYSNVGDRFYVVIPCVKHPQVLRVFNTRVYTYRP